MGQNNTKPQQQQQQPEQQQQQRPTERRRTSSRRHDTPELAIKPQGTFDSHFTLISPMSELSAPSMFLSKRHEQNIASTLPPGTNPQNANNIIIPNVPPLPAELQYMANNSSNRNVERQQQRAREDAPLLKKKKGKKHKKTTKQQKAQRVKEAFAGCVIVTAGHADKMRVATTKAVKKTGKMIEDSGVVEKSGIAALNCAKATKAVAAAGAKELAGAVKKGCIQSKISNEEERKSDRMSEAARSSLEIVNESNQAVVFPVEDPRQAPQVPFEAVWRESRGMMSTTYAPSNPADAYPGSSLDEVTTPLAQLDHAFKAAVGLHSEDDYFERLSAGPTAPSPFVQALPDISAIPQVESSRDTSVSASLFSETTLTRLDTADPDFARDVNQQPASKKISDFDAVVSKKAPTKKPVSTGVLKELKKRRDSSDTKKSYQRAEEETSVAGRESIESIKQKFEAKPAAKTTRAASTRSIFRQMDARKKDTGIKEAKSFGSLRVTESAPSVMEAKDYRNIALSTSEGAYSAATAPGRIQPKYYTLCSPASSTCSTGENSKGPLLTTQTLSNAAFLFSPSYAGGDEQLLQREQATRDPAFSISTFASRARISNFSSRSQAVTIPVSKSWEASSASVAEGKEYDFSGGHSLDKSNKHVRFSEANQYREIQSSKPFKANDTKSSLSVQTKKKVPEKVETPVIETKLSDLTEATMLDRRVSFDGVSPATTASSLSNLDDRRISFSQPSLGEISPASNGSSPSNSEFESKSRTSSASEQGSVHWTYREENGKITTTPKFGKKRTTTISALPTTSPMVRFRSAQNKFANPAEKVVPVKKTPPKKFANRTPKKDLVSTRINVLNDRLKSTRQPVAKNTRRDTGGHRVLAPHRANLVNPIFRNSSSSTDHDDQRIMRSVTNEETPFDETERNVSPAAASRNSSEDMFAKLILGGNGLARNDVSLSIADTEASEDPFAEIIHSNYEAEPEIPGPSMPQRGARLSGNSVYSFASHTSNIKRYSSGSTVVTNKENTVSLTNLHKASGRGQVNPADAYNHHDSVANLCLSPTQRTPMQARKWRTMAAAAQEKESSKKSNSKRSNRKALSERSINVH